MLTKKLKNSIEQYYICEATPYGSGVVSNPVIGQFKGLDPNSTLSWGGALLSNLRSSLSKNFDIKVKDFGPQLFVEITYNNIKTCKSASASFCVVITTEEGNGFVKSSSVRYRAIGNVSQAASYILSRKQELISKTESTN